MILQEPLKYITLNQFSEEGKTPISVKYSYLVIEHRFDKSGKVIRIKSLVLNFTPKIECICKTKYIAVILT